MNPAKTATAEDYTLRSAFLELREKLREQEYADRVQKPLAFWALPKDRRLPYALLGRPVCQIVDTSFEELASTPGIGRKKITSLIMLLRRVVADAPAPIVAEEPAIAIPIESTGQGAFDASLVSESVWQQWRETATRFGLEREKLGRLAPSLQSLPTVIWDTPLSSYMSLDLGELRSLKTHGDKRVGVILEVFCSVHQLLENVPTPGAMVIRLLPRFVASLEQWISETLQTGTLPELQDLRQHLLLPMLNQIELDGGEPVHRLAAGRMGVEGPAESVRLQAQRLNVTRARIYQLLETCAQIMAVRWPEGRWQLATLEAKFQGISARDERSALLTETRNLMFPARQVPVPAEPALVAAD
jgi:hypothetical protein